METNRKIRWNQVLISMMIGIALGLSLGELSECKVFRSHWKHGNMRQRMLKKLDRELHLTADQKTKVEVIFEAKHPQMEALQQEMKPKFEALRQSTQAEVSKVLNPDQQKKFEALNAKMEERWKERSKFFST